MSRELPPSPSRFRSMEEWATAFYEFYLAQSRIEVRNDPLPVLLAHRTGGITERASVDGIVLYDPVLDSPVISINGAWVPFLTEKDVAISQFGEQLVAERTPLIELNSAYGTSVLRDVETVAGSGAISSPSTGEILLSTGATASSSALLQSAESGRYIPGFAAEIGIGVRVPSVPTGNQVLYWGGTDDVAGGGGGAGNGFYFGYDATGVFIAKSTGATETKVYQSSWNLDKLDGTGSSGLTLDMTAGNIFQIEFTWYGYGEIVYQVVLTDGKGNQRPIKVHYTRVEGSTSIQSPNLYLFAEADNGGDASDIDLYVGGRSYTILGRYIPARRVTSQERASVSTGTTRVPLITFKRKTGFLDRSLRALEFDVDISSQPVIVEVVLDATLTGASYGTPTNHTAAECAVEVDTAATAMTGGHVLFAQYFPAGQGNKTLGGTSGPLGDIEIPRDQPVTLAARTLTGSGSIVSTFRVQEEW